MGKWWRQTVVMEFSESEGNSSDEECCFSGSSDEYSCDEVQKVSESVLASKAFTYLLVAFDGVHF